MANTATLDPTGNLKKGVSQRALASWHSWMMSFTSNADYLYATMDTIEVGALAVGWFINNLTADGAGTGVKFTPQMSIDGANWTDIKWKDQTGSETASGETTIAQNTTQYVMINFASYPEYLCARYFRLKVQPSTNAASVFYLFAVVK